MLLQTQEVRATRHSPKGHACWDQTGSSDSSDHIRNPSVPKPGPFWLKAPMIGAVPRVTSSSPSNYQSGQDIPTTATDIRGARTCATHSERLRPPSTGFNLAQAIDRGRASLGTAQSSGATHKGPPQSTSDHRAAAGEFSSQAGLECRLTLPHGTRGHKRPRLEDKLNEVLPAACFVERHIFDSTHSLVVL